MKRRRLQAPRGTVSVERVAGGVARVRAGHWLDAWYALGWLHGRDRGAQLALARVVGQGRICELLRDDDDLLEMDRYFRRFGMARDAHHHIGRVASPYADQLHAYVNGLNRAWQERTPLLLRLARFTPEPYQPADVLLLVKLMAFSGLAEGQRITELFVIEALRRGTDPALLKGLLPALDNVDPALVRGLRRMPPLFPGARLTGGLPVTGGSNAWAVAGSRSSSGAPLLANDPHLEVNRLPALLYEAELRVGERWIKGATIPGLPGFVAGRTPSLAWGVTYSCADTSDFFVERCKDAQYLRDGQWAPFRRRRERILRRSHAAEEMVVHENEHGILEGDPREAGDYLCWNWTGLGEGGLGAIRAYADLIQCDSVDEARRAVEAMDIPTLHMVFADHRGNIGCQTTGAVPRRPRHWSGLAPAAGFERRNDWRGRLDPAHELPGETNPGAGYIVVTNEARQCPGGPRLATIWLSDYRRERVEELLARHDRNATVEDMQRLQYDVVSRQARRFLTEYLPLLEDEPLRAQLQQWNLEYSVDSTAAARFEALHREVVAQVFGPALGEEWLRDLLANTGLYPTLIGFFDDVLAQPDSAWLPAGRRRERLRGALARGAAVPSAAWGEVNRVLFRNLLLGSKWRWFNRGPHGLAGNAATVHQGTLLRLGRRNSSFAPCYHLVTDMSSDRVRTNLPGGPSEWPLSLRYANDLRRWLSGRYKEW
ncbi:MAG: penicillin acylase family protein [Gammaproteobacteria bacterium]